MSCKVFCVVVLLGIIASGSANRICYNPDTLFNGLEYGFSQAVEMKGTRHISIAGQTAINPAGVVVGSTRKEQMVHCFENIKIAIETAGGTLDDIASLRIFMVNYDPEEGSAVTEVLKQVFPADSPPASTWIGVQSLARKEILVEIEATAILP